LLPWTAWQVTGCVFSATVGETPLLAACMRRGGRAASAVHGRPSASVLPGRSPASLLRWTGHVWRPHSVTA